MLIGLLALAVADSVNPSAIAVTLYLLDGERVAAQVLVYVAAIFATYLTLGVLMVSGLDALWPSLTAAADGRLRFVMEGVIGLALLVYAVRAPKSALSTQRVEPTARTFAALALLGVTVTLMELPTAVPYLGAIALLTAAEMPLLRALPLLLLYNVVFVLPPLLLLAGHLAFGKRLAARYAALRARVHAGARETMLWIAGLVGGGLLVSSVIELLARLR